MKNTQALTEAYIKPFIQEFDSNRKIDTLRAPRDGTTHKRLKNTEDLQSNTPSTSTINPLINKTAAPIKILPTTTTARKFLGSQFDNSARKFISLCDDVMKNLCVIEQEDEIAFIKSRLLPGSSSSKLIQATIFCGPQEGNDYKTFVIDFLQTPDLEGEANIAKGIIQAVESTNKNMTA